jgi:hypothetical protein
MFKDMTTCIRCGAAVELECSDFPDNEPEEKRRLAESHKSVEGTVRSGADQYLCDDCEEKIDERFVPETECRRSTLNFTLELDQMAHESALAELGQLIAAIDPRLISSLPPGAASHRPALASRLESQQDILAILRRVGKPVAYFEPERGKDPDAAYLVYDLNEEGKPCFRHVTAVELVAMGDVACALDYDCDGNPLNRHLEG